MPTSTPQEKVDHVEEAQRLLDPPKPVVSPGVATHLQHAATPQRPVLEEVVAALKERADEAEAEWQANKDEPWYRAKMRAHRADEKLVREKASQLPSEGREELTMIALALKNVGIEAVTPERGVEIAITRMYQVEGWNRENQAEAAKAWERAEAAEAKAQRYEEARIRIEALRVYNDEQIASRRCAMEQWIRRDDVIAALSDNEEGTDGA